MGGADARAPARSPGGAPGAPLPQLPRVPPRPRTTRMSVTIAFTCPRCGYSVTDAMRPAFGPWDNRPPQPGDLSLCIVCAAPLRWDDEHHEPRWLTADELHCQLRQGPRETVALLLRAMVAILTMRPSRCGAVRKPSPAGRG